MEFGRERYLKLLLEREHNGLIKVITGMRRNGKSFLMNELF
jgi:AAA+ ATPase superfamily predicted ATPase